MTRINTQEMVERLRAFRPEATLMHQAADLIERQASQLAGVVGERDALRAAMLTIGSQAICYGMHADETELRDWLRFISETAEAALSAQPPAQGASL